MLEWLTLIMTPLNDVTTSPHNPPAFVEISKLPENKDRTLEYDQAMAQVQAKLHPEVLTFRTSANCEKVWSEVQRIARAESSWTIVNINERDLRVEAIATTPMMKFKDDIVILVRESQSQIQVDMRSKSRLGKSDLGANAKRIQAFFAQLKLALR